MKRTLTRVFGGTALAVSLLGGLPGHLPAASAVACTKTWTNGGGDSNWATPGNWSPAGAPAATDFVCITAGGTINVTSAASAQTLLLGAGSGSTYSFLNVTDATLTVTQGGTLSSLGVLKIFAEAATGEVSFGANVNNSGFVELASESGQQAIVAVTSGTFTNDPQGELTDISVPSYFGGPGTDSVQAIVDNKGAIQTGFAAPVHVSGGTLTNEGVIDTAAGFPLYVDGGANFSQTSTGSFQCTMEPPAYTGAIILNGGTATLAGALHGFVTGGSASPGQSYPCVQAPAVNGAFDTFDPMGSDLLQLFTSTRVTLAVPYEEDDAAVSLGGWGTQADAGASGGSYHVSAVKGDTAMWNFSGTSLSLLTHQGPDQGRMRITVDGNVTMTVDNYHATAGPKSVAMPSLGAGKHRVTVKVLGTKRTASSGTAVAIDGYTVGAKTTDDNGPSITWSGWRSIKSSSAQGGTYRLTSQAGSSASITMTGSSFNLVTEIGPAYGDASVSIDGGAPVTIDLYSPTLAYRIVNNIATGPSALHQISVAATGTKDPASTGTAIPLDGFVVIG